MKKAHYSTIVLVKNGKVRRSTPVGIEEASEEQKQVIDLVKPLMNTWLRSNIDGDMECLVKTKICETAAGFSVEFKVQSAKVPVE